MNLYVQLGTMWVYTTVHKGWNQVTERSTEDYSKSCQPFINVFIARHETLNYYVTTFVKSLPAMSLGEWAERVGQGEVGLYTQREFDNI